MDLNELLLLKIIEKNANISILLRRNFTYSQIAMLLQKLIEKGYISNKLGSLKLTKSGENILLENVKKLNLPNKSFWLPRQEQYYRTPLSQEVIILPKKI